MKIRKTEACDFDEVLGIYEHAREMMRTGGNPTQWGTTHPPRELVEKDIAEGTGYVLLEDGVIHGAFAFILGDDPTYSRIDGGAWLNDEPYGTIHRIASDGKVGGVLAEAVKYCSELTGEIRIDTHSDNRIMRHLLEKLGFERCGVIYVADGSPRIAYQLHTRRTR